jgi:uncharacterized protein YndB with AHSA1/START domain
LDPTAEATLVEREVRIAASPETIWEFLVDPVKAVRWMGIEASLDARPGGAYRIEVLPGEVAAGVFVELDPPHRLVHTWGWASGGRADMPPGSSRVEIDLSPVEGGTRLRLRHSSLPNGQAATGHGRGWEHYLERLSAAVTGAALGPDPWVETGVPWR